MDYLALIQDYLKKSITWWYTVVSKWWDYEVIICEGMIFRFPKNQDKLLDIKAEKKNLDIIAPRVSLPVPHYTIVDNTFIVYPLIQGVTLDELSSPYTDQVISDLSQFIKELHSIPLEVFDYKEEVKQESEEDKKGFHEFVNGLKQTIEIRLSGKVPATVITNLHQYMDELFFTYSSPKKAFVHGDLQGKNIIYNQNTDKISWIVDFTDSRVGSIELDFCHFYELGDGILEKMVQWYAWFVDKDFIERVFFLSRRGVIFEIENDDLYANKFDYLLTQLQKYKFM